LGLDTASLRSAGSTTERRDSSVVEPGEPLPWVVEPGEPLPSVVEPGEPPGEPVSRPGARHLFALLTPVPSVVGWL
jgi:hypothetical protein